MNRITIFLAAAMAAATALAAPFWTVVTTEGAGGETSGKTGNYKNMYYCTKEAAKDVFDGRTTAQSIAAYLSAAEWLYEDAVEELSGGKGTSLAAYGYDSGTGAYTFSDYVASALIGDYIAIVAYNDGKSSKDMVRVFSAKADSFGTLTFDPGDGEGNASDWVQAPEPTGGLLMLLGMAALALKRKRAGA